MNYIRGALQYYKDLPPINASTLTGAIDVIVVRRPGEDNQEELASTPFHVRFGKWQILRPAEKKVTATVNGKVMPFNMKIGEAGEAFFVFETDGDVADDLITSPITSPRLTPSNSSATNLGDATAEPDQFDLDGDMKPGTSLPSSPKDPTGPLDRVGQLGRSIATVVSEEGKETLDHLKDELHLLANAVKGVPVLDEAVVESDQVAAPTIRVDGDILLDTSGYHLEPPPESSPQQEIPPHGRPRVKSITSSRSSTPMTISRANSPSFSEASSPTSPNSFISKPSSSSARGQSAPPEAVPLGLSTSLPYEWDWGSFPQRSPSKLEFNQEQLFRASSVPLDIDATSDAGDNLNSEPEEVLFGLGGLLRPDPQDPYLFTLVLGDSSRPQSATVHFELSLCGSLSGKAELVMDDSFNKARVSYRKAMAKASVLRSESLVIKWGIMFVSRNDASPLFGALLHWRENTISSQGYTSDGEPLSSGDDLTDDEDAQPKKLNPPNTTGWTSWWRRGWTEKKPTQKKRPTVFDLEFADPALQSVPLAPSRSEPDLIELDRVPLVSTAPPSPPPVETAKTASQSQPQSQPPSQPQSQAQSQFLSQPQKRYAKTLRLTSEQLKQLELRPGYNDMKFSLSSPEVPVCTARIFLWDHTEHIVVSDIDGTITKSDALGHVLTLIGRDWTHLGVAKLYTDIVKNGYKIMYLTSRAIGQADSTRDYLKGINQNNYQLPEGPVIMSPDRLMASLHREVIMRKPEVFKMACLRDILRLFGNTSRNPFYAGFGNRITDALSYRSVNIPSTRIFTIDSTGEVKTELLEKAGYKSSYIHMNDLVDQQFPPVHRRWLPEYTDFNYWRAMPDIEVKFPDLAPPSPTLSARSDTSNASALNRLRQFSLGAASAKPGPQPQALSLPPKDLERDGHLRSMSSFDRLRTLVGYGSSESLAIPEERTMEEIKAQRRLSNASSMPGSLPGESHFPFGDDDNEENEKDLEANEPEESGEDGEDEDEGDEGERSFEDDMDEMFDEDLRTTDKMKDVPFL